LTLDYTKKIVLMCIYDHETTFEIGDT